MNGAVFLLALSLSVAAFPQSTQLLNTQSEIPKLQSMADAGDPAAQLALGVAYQNGRGVKQNDALAVDWYRKAAGAGNSEAQNDLGVMYMNGWGVEKNKGDAVHWYRLAAKQKNAHAMFNLGAAYYNGDGVGIDDTRAYAWFLLAQDGGSERATDAVQRAERELQPGTLDRATADIAEMYFKGDELNRDYKEGVRWLRKAAGHGDRASQLLLADMLMDGVDLPPDYEEARQWCEAAFKQKSAMAAYCLGDIYRKGLGTTKDPNKALTLLRQVADSGIVPAMVEAADMLASGEAGKVEQHQALIYFIRAMLRGDEAVLPKAAEILAQMSDKEWKKTREEMTRHLLGDHAKLDAVFQTIQTSSTPK